MKTYSITISNVDTNGAVAVLNIDPGLRRYIWGEIRIEHLSGSATATEVAVTTDAASTGTPGTFVESLAVVQYDDPDYPFNQTNPIADDNGGDGFSHGAEDSAGVVAVHLTPNAGADNSYKVTLIVRRTH